MLKKILLCFCIFLSITINVFAIDTQIESVKEELDINSLIQTLEEYTDESIELENEVDNLFKGQSINYGKIGNFIFNKLFYEIRAGLKTGITILIIVIIMAIIQGLELEKDSGISKITSLVGFLLIASIILKNYVAILKVVLDTVTTLSSIVQIVAPVMFSMLIATGEITTTGLISPIILFVTGLIGTIVNYVVVPFLTLALVFKLINNMSQSIKVEKFSKLFESTAFWTISVIFALFLGVLELQSSITTSIDEVTIKTTQAAVSNLIPVVGKFVSDSLEVVMGASEVIGKAVGVIGILVIVVVAVVPIIKLGITSFIYFLISAFSEMLDADDKITKLLSSMSSQYKVLIGVMVGVTITFVIGLAVIINLIGKIAT